MDVHVILLLTATDIQVAEGDGWNHMEYAVQRMEEYFRIKRELDNPNNL